MPLDKNINDIIFISNDEKDDWWDKDDNENLEIRRELLDEFKENNPDISINFMTMGMFQKYASKVFDLYEFGVYVDLNRNDELFVKRISDTISDDIIEEICNNPYSYLYSGDIGSEGIEDIDIDGCKLIDINEVSSACIDGKVYIYYNLEYEIELSCISYEYCGKDEDTKEVIRTPGIEHNFKGSVIVSIERIVGEQEIVSRKNYLDEDDDYQGFEIIDNNLK